MTKLNWEKSARNSRMGTQPVTAVIKPKKLKPRRKNQPTPNIKTLMEWHKEFLESGAQYRMSYAAFRGTKLGRWRKERKERLKRMKRSKSS